MKLYDLSIELAEPEEGNAPKAGSFFVSLHTIIAELYL